MINYTAEGVALPKFNISEINRWIKTVAAGYEKKTGNITYIFCSDEKILEVNKQFLQHDYYTDIITFDYTEGNVISGDIFISTDTVKDNSIELGTEYEKELMRIVIHGILHLCGQDDQTPELRKEMIQKEDMALLLIEK